MTRKNTWYKRKTKDTWEIQVLIPQRWETVEVKAEGADAYDKAEALRNENPDDFFRVLPKRKKLESAQ